MTTVRVELPEATVGALRRMAEERETSFDSLVDIAVAEFLKAEQMRAEFQRRADRRRHVDIDAIIVKVPDVPPMPGDEID